MGTLAAAPYKETNMSADFKQFPIPEKTNLALFLVSFPLIWGLLWSASHLSWGWALTAALIFSQANHLPFSLLHESVHDVLSASTWRNQLLGRLCAAAFPTSYTLQKIAHLNHHRRNRTDLDLYDYYLPSQSQAHRNFGLYAGNLLGLYWFCIPLSTLIYFFFPWIYTSSWFAEKPARLLEFETYVKEIGQHPKKPIWLECGFAVVYQVFIFWALDLNWQGWLLCHWAFALHWSALQYADHAWSVRDIINGAWNLKVNPITRAFALNYHYHLVHHRFPWLPWIHLPKKLNPNEAQPSFWSIYFRLWGGVRPAPPMAEPDQQTK